jgi:hypothetical protein
LEIPVSRRYRYLRAAVRVPHDVLRRRRRQEEEEEVSWRIP